MRHHLGVLVALLVTALLAGCMGTESPEERRQAFVAANPHLDERTLNAVLEGKIFIGMPAAAAEASWGKPSSVHRSVGIWGVSEQWVYALGYSKLPYAYVYIDNGVVSSWQLMY